MTLTNADIKKHQNKLTLAHADINKKTFEKLTLKNVDIKNTLEKLTLKHADIKQHQKIDIKTMLTLRNIRTIEIKTC